MRTSVQHPPRQQAAFDLARPAVGSPQQQRRAPARPAKGFGQDFSRVPISAPSRATLALSSPGDRHEQEAERMAEAVVAGSSAPMGEVTRNVTPKLYRAALRLQDMVDSVLVPEEERGAEAPETPPAVVQRSAITEGGAVDAAFERSVQQAVHRGGERLAAPTRSFMESRFGRDFSSVRVHHDAQADTLSRGIQARAFTLGNDIFFSRTQYRPQAREGQKLLAHELTHVVQQSAGRVSRQIQRATSCSSYPSYDASRALNTYNCAGLALRTYLRIPTASATVSSIADNFINPQTSVGSECGAGRVKFWLWEYDLHFEDDLGAQVQYRGMTFPIRDFHIVAGRVGPRGGDPRDVYSKNGSRPVHGPGSGSSFRPAARERNLMNDASEAPLSTSAGRPQFVVRNNITERITCADCHP